MNWPGGRVGAENPMDAVVALKLVGKFCDISPMYRWSQIPRLLNLGWLTHIHQIKCGGSCAGNLQI